MATGGGSPRRHGDVVARSELTLRPTEEYRGGAAALYRCHYGGRRWLYKEYRKAFLDRVDEAALARLVAWRRGLGPGERDQLDRLASWPRFRVRDASGALRGVLIPVARLPFSYLSRHRHRQPRTIDVLIRLNADGIVRAGAPPAVKRRALGRTAQVVLWLHERGVVVNDVQARNVLCTNDGGAVYLVDCDAMIGPWGQVAPPQAPPYVREVVPDADRPNQTTDLARLAWMTMWTLLDDFSGVATPVDRLTRLAGAAHADLLVRTGRAGRESPAPVAQWRELAREWGGGFEWAAPPPRVLTGTVLPSATTTRGQRRPVDGGRRPHQWVPPRFRRRYHQQPPLTVLRAPAAAGHAPAGHPSAGHPSAGPAPAGRGGSRPPASPGRGRISGRWLAVLIIAALVGVLAVADMLWAVWG